jgi:N-acetyl-alpha-D-glucosaminyl L-malate synthase BshA
MNTTNPMKIGITCYPTYGGSGVVATELGMELAARGHDIHFISYAPPVRLNPGTKNIAFHEVEISSYPLFDHAPYSLTLAVKMMEVAESEHLDLLHVHYAIPHSVSALLARAMAAPRRLPFITTLHGTDITLVGNNRSFLPITKFSIEQSDGVTAISHYLKKATLEEFDIKRPIEVIPNFVNCDLYSRKDDPALRAEWAPNGEPIVMHLSNFRPVKRATDAVEIFSLVRQKLPAKLVLMGDGPDRGAVEWLIRQKKLSKDVFLLGKQDRVYEKLGVADLFLLPSDLESFGLAALEAMACEVPVIATNVGGLPEVVEHGVDGFLVPPRDVAAAAKFAIEILSLPDRGREMGRLARANAQRKYCANDVIPQYEAYYRQVLAESAAPNAANTNAANTNAPNTDKADAAGISPIST